MKTIKIPPGQLESWRALFWGAYVTHIVKPDWHKYVRGIMLFPITGHTSADSRFDEKSPAKGPCFCDICKSRPNYPHIFGKDLRT